MTRNGKIARLPRTIRDELNRRLQDGQCGRHLLAWLNGLEEVKRLLEQEFEGRPINDQNLTEWRQGGHQDWLARQELLSQAREMAADAEEVKSACDGLLTDHLALLLTSRYAGLVSTWNGELDEEFRRKLRGLRWLCQDITELRRGDHFAERLRLDRERMAEAVKEDLDRVLEALAAEAKMWPEVRQAYQDAGALFKKYQSGEYTDANRSSGAQNQTDSN